MLKIVNFILDTLAPPDLHVRKIEAMNMTDFLIASKTTNTEKTILGIISFLPYRNETVKKAITELKSYGNKKIAKLLAKVTHELIIPELTNSEHFKDFTNPLFIPIPITKKKKRGRGWNQCELISKEIEKIEKLNKQKIFEMNYKDFIKFRETEDQVGKNRTERIKNVIDSFTIINLENIKDRNVIVFDDIVTTGATLLEAKKILLKAQAKKVICIALAH